MAAQRSKRGGILREHDIEHDIERELVVGDIARLKSGGPRMTVELVGRATNGKEGLFCVWFAGEGVRRGSFRREVLRLVEHHHHESPEGN